MLVQKMNGRPDPPAILSYLGLNDSAEEVVELKNFLYVTGDLKNRGSGQPVFDPDVEQAVKHFQRRHGLMVDGIVGGETIQEMNKPVEVYINKVKANMNRLRILPYPMPEKYISVNLPEYRLHYFEQGREQGTMKIIIGDLQNETPMLLDTLEYLVFSPKWYVPATIAREELFPKILGDSTYASERKFVVLKSGKEIPIDTLNKTDVEQHAPEYRIVQQPGPQNALGRIKFIFPNQRSIYLHDTPADYLFDQDRRHLSHGCVRVENPVELARFVLNDPDKYPLDSIFP
ncbi:MAG: L,D-transpeptidase family protein, partial [Bacteroidales bacterium]|nr:L,D-transpeptidase family protein [Bacteroidales bacterium]